MEQEQRTGEITSFQYLIRIIEKDPLSEKNYREGINQYKTMEEVMERFEYWTKQPNIVIVEAVSAVTTTALLAQWRKDEIAGYSSDVALATESISGSVQDEGIRAVDQDGVPVSNAEASVQDSSTD